MKWAATLTVAAAAVSLASVQACPTGFVNLADEGSPEVCLLFLKTETTWEGMRTNCQVMGHDLAKLTGNLHQRVIEYVRSHSDLTGKVFWVGGTDQVVEGSWKWIADDTDIPLGTPHWYPCHKRMEPDGGTDQNHLCLYNPDFYFHSCKGDSHFYGICQVF